MTKVAITGGSGKLGRAVINELYAHGYTVFNFDLVPPPSPSPATFTRIDLRDYGQAIEALRGVDSLHDGVDALVHLAAIPGPTHAGNATTFVNNITCSYHVYSAARAAGITNIVWASSETLYGYPFHRPPPYVPVDEDCPARPEVAYALAKCLEEEMAEQLCRWSPELKMIGLRFSNVVDETDYPEFPGFDRDPSARSWNLWSYIDSQDGAQAVRKALEYQATGAHVFGIAGPDTVMLRPTSALLDEMLPDVERRAFFTGNEALISIEKARAVLGYEPTRSWRAAVQA
jgi:nucleoside-diphosphate-sugar epimerase